MTEIPKLTRAQWFLLVEASEDGAPCYRSSRPAKRLVELGLCEWRAGIRRVLDITYEGRVVLAQLPLAIGKVIEANRDVDNRDVDSGESGD